VDSVADPDRVTPCHFSGSGSVPRGCLGSGSVSYSNGTKKLKEGKIYQRIPFVWVLLDLLTRKIK
jgi:hypothetical protein